MWWGYSAIKEHRNMPVFMPITSDNSDQNVEYREESMNHTHSQTLSAWTNKTSGATIVALEVTNMTKQTTITACSVPWPLSTVEEVFNSYKSWQEKRAFFNSIRSSHESVKEIPSDAIKLGSDSKDIQAEIITVAGTDPLNNADTYWLQVNWKGRRQRYELTESERDAVNQILNSDDFDALKDWVRKNLGNPLDWTGL